jgi:polyvinyl alcohol dehydrogenase (cytochrome)
VRSSENKNQSAGISLPLQIRLSNTSLQIESGTSGWSMSLLAKLRITILSAVCALSLFPASSQSDDSFSHQSFASMRIALALSRPASNAGDTRLPLDSGQIANRCPSSVKLGPLHSPSWKGWSTDPGNWRFQPANQAGISVGAVPKLKLKWAFGIPKVSRSQPAVFRGRVYAGSYDGFVYSLDARTGCTFWETPTKPVRTGFAIGRAGLMDAVFFGDATGGVTALDAVSGKHLWTAKLGDHPLAVITATPGYYDGRVYVSMSSHEDQARNRAGYKCCSFRGSVTALDANTGRIIWRTYMTGSPKPHGKTAKGDTIVDPTGMGIWSSPTFDVARQRIYVGTGDKYTELNAPTATAAVALDLKTGRILWSKQFTKEDIYKMECGSPPTAGCVVADVPDYDISASPILVKLPSGRRALLLGQKTGLVYSIDPDANGKLLWHQRAGSGGLIGGIHRGMATDGKSVYVAVSDMVFIGRDPDPTKGGGLWAYRISDGKPLWRTPPPPACGDRKPCSPAQSQAVTAIPGVVFSGSIDGHLRAFSTTNGEVIWDFDTARPFKSVNDVAATGGSLDTGGPVVAGGMVYVVSGYAEFGALPGNALLAFGAD